MRPEWIDFLIYINGVKTPESKKDRPHSLKCSNGHLNQNGSLWIHTWYIKTIFFGMVLFYRSIMKMSRKISPSRGWADALGIN